MRAKPGIDLGDRRIPGWRQWPGPQGLWPMAATRLRRRPAPPTTRGVRSAPEEHRGRVPTRPGRRRPVARHELRPSGDPAVVASLASYGASEVPHPGGTLLAHLERVHALLGEWGSRPAVRLAGL